MYSVVCIATDASATAYVVDVGDLVVMLHFDPIIT